MENDDIAMLDPSTLPTQTGKKVWAFIVAVISVAGLVMVGGGTTNPLSHFSTNVVGVTLIASVALGIFAIAARPFFRKEPNRGVISETPWDYTGAWLALQVCLVIAAGLTVWLAHVSLWLPW